MSKTRHCRLLHSSIIFWLLCQQCAVVFCSIARVPPPPPSIPFPLLLSSIARFPREAINGQDVGGMNIEWLTDQQLSELGQTANKSARMEKLRQFFDAMESGTAKEEATQKIVKKCYDWIKEVASEEEQRELEQTHHENHAKCKQKVREFLGRMEEGSEKEQVESRLPFCEHVWYTSHDSQGHHHHHHHHHRDGEEHPHGQHHHHHQDEHQHHAGKRWIHRHPRDHFDQDDGEHEHHTLEDYLQTHLSWLSDEQKEQMRTIKDQGKAALQGKAMEFFEQSTGEQREKAIRQLQSGCRELLRRTFGEEKTTELKQLKESGANTEQMEAKIKEMTEKLEDEGKKARMNEYGPACKKIFMLSQSRRRRTHHEGHEGDHGQHSIEDYFRTHLNWLSQEQKDELKQLKEQGKTRGELQQKVSDWFDAAQGETKKQAIELLQGGCKELARMVLGEEKANKLKEMRESGTNPDKVKEQALQWISEIQDEHKKQMAEQYKPICSKAFEAGKVSRRRREEANEDEDEHNIEDTIEDHLDTHLRWLNDQQKEQLKRMLSSRVRMHQMVLEWFRQLEDQQREEAAGIIKKGCRDLSKVVLGEAKNREIAMMKQAGVSGKAVSAKIDQWIEEMEEGWRKTVALEHKEICHEVYKPKRNRRSNRHRHRHQEDEEESADMEQESSQNHREGRVEEGDEEGEEVQLEDSERRRHGPRNYQNANGEDGESNGNYRLGGNHNLDRHHSWLNRNQKKMLKQMRDKGHADHELHDKIHQFYQVSPDEVKATARGILQKGCEAILQRLFGNYKAEEIIQMREEGASNAEVDAKIDEALALIRNPEKREEAARFALTCRRIFAMIERRRREVAPAEKTLEELFKSHLSWLNEEQKAELKQNRDQGVGRTDLQQKVMSWFGNLEGQPRAEALEHLRDGCRELLASVIGVDNANELKRLRENGATEEQLEAKATQLISGIQDKQKGALAKEFGPTCKQIFQGA